MRSIRSTVLVAGISASLLSFSHAQQTTTTPPADEFQAVMQAIEATPYFQAVGDPFVRK
jgi:hypothetical protein